MRKLLLLMIMAVSVCTVQAQKIATLIAASPNHTLLDSAINAAGLSGFYEGDGPITFFAPTDDAFGALGPGLLDAFFTQPDELLQDIILYHTLPGSFASGSFTDGQSILTTLTGQSVTITISNDTIWVNDAMITQADIPASNGPIHVTDGVLLPDVNTVYDFIAESADHTTLTAALDATGLDATLDGGGAFTVFAPTDAAFDALPEGILDALLSQPDGLLSDILLYHVLDSAATSGGLADGTMLQTILGQDVTVSNDGSTIMINGATVSVADQITINGVVHVIDAVLMPDSMSIYDVVADNEDLTSLKTSIDNAGLMATLDAPGAMTLFAPTNSAFDALPQGALELLNADPTGALSDVLLNHVVGSVELSADLADATVLTSLGGGSLTVSNDGSTISINGAEVTVSDMLATNGVVHVIDMVLLPDDVFCGDFDAGPYTNFTTTFGGVPAAVNGVCPFNEITGFQSWASESYQANNAVAGTTYTFSICDGPDAGSWEPELSIYGPDGQLVAIAQDCEITWTAPVDGDYIWGIQEVGYCGAESPNLSTDNGYPSMTCESLNTVYTYVSTNPDLSMLDSALVAAELAETLNGEGPFTLFAPTDIAFDALPENLFSALMSDPTGLLSDILLYHVVDGNLPSANLGDGDMLVTLNGEQISISVSGDDIFVNEAMVTIADLTTDNGVVHIIDAVLIPENSPTVYDIVAESDDHNTFQSIIDAAELDTELSGTTPYTLFAPTDAAFDAWPEGVLDALLASPVDTLERFVEYHMVDGINLSSDLTAGPLTTVEGSDAIVTIDGSTVMIDTATVVTADIPAINGVVHSIDAPLSYMGFSLDVGEVAVLAYLGVYPNPASGNFTIDYTLLDAADLTVDLLNPLGQNLNSWNLGRRGAGVYQEQIDITGFATGLYLLRINVGDKQTVQKVQIAQ